MADGEFGEKQIMLITVGAVLLVVLGLGAGVFFGYKKMSDYREESRKLEQKLTQLKQRVGQREERESELHKIRMQADEYLRLLPSAEDLSDFWKEISEQARRTGLNYVSSKVERDIDDETEKQGPRAYVKIGYSYVFRGGYHEIAKFVNEVEEHMNRYLEIDRIEIFAVSAGLVPGVKGGNGHLLTLRMITYRYLGETQAGP